MIQNTSAQDVILEKSEKRPLWFKLVAASIVVIIIGWLMYPSLSAWSSSDRSVDSSRLRMAQVERGDFVRDISLQGNIVAANSPKLYAPAIGTVTLLVNPGATVEQGQTVARVSSPSLTNRLQQELSTLESLQIALERQKIATKQAQIKSRQQIQLEKVVLDAAKREQRRAEKSVKIQALSQLDYEKAIDDLKRSQLKYDFAIEQAELEKENLAFELRTRESEFNQYQLLVENTQRLVSELDMKAPVSGIVGSWSVEQKSAVALNQALLTIVDLSAFEVEVDIPEAYADTLGIGMTVNVKYNGKEYDASVATISPEVNNNVVKGRVTFIAEPPPGIKQNQRVTSRVIIEEKNDVLYLPRGSFIQHHAGMKIFVVEENTAILTAIELGARSIDKIEVVGGLSQGQRVVISNTDFVGKAERLNLN
jgi:HlyD family secretion protein